MTELPEFISLGVGVQSSTLAFMADCGEVGPMPKAAMFGDTTQEPKQVYEYLKYLRATIKNFPIIDGSYGNLGEDSLRVRRSQKSGRNYLAIGIPLFVKNPDGSKGIIGRKCTRDYKISVVGRGVKKLLGLKRVRKTSGILARTWVGISLDEEERQKPSKTHWIENRWPLLELGMTREDCLEWMQEHGYQRPPRSSCIQCPYHSDETWLDLKNNHPADFQYAVEWERRVQAAAAQQEVLEGKPFCHSSLVVLDQVQFNPGDKKDKFNRTCEGMCGV